MVLHEQLISTACSTPWTAQLRRFALLRKINSEADTLPRLELLDAQLNELLTPTGEPPANVRSAMQGVSIQAGKLLHLNGIFCTSDLREWVCLESHLMPRIFSRAI
jgi:hypothetical protein